IDLHEAVDFAIKTEFTNLGMDFIGDCTPAAGLVARCRCRRAIKGNPGHHFGMNEVLTSAADLPNAFVRLSPGLGQILQGQWPHASTPPPNSNPCFPVQGRSAIPPPVTVIWSCWVGPVPNPTSEEFLIPGSHRKTKSRSHPPPATPYIIWIWLG